MDIAEWLLYIEKLHSKPIDLGLKRLLQIPNIQSLNSFQCPVVTIGGTNGKGSNVAFLEAILLAAGYEVGAYTSPHLLRYNERIRINGQEVSDDALCFGFEKINGMRGNTSLSFFEFTTLVALYLFKQAKLNIILLEVGLGGRLDAVNIVDADIAIIASIALDHMQYLGDTREEIGRQKAGIMRSQHPVICGDSDIPDSILQHAKKLNAPLYTKDCGFQYQKKGNTWSWQSQNNRFDHLPLLQLPMQNAATALMALELLETKLPVNEASLRQGLSQACLPGRFQVIGRIVLDVAHNPAAAELLAQQLLANPVPGNKQIAVIGMLTDKDIQQTLKPLAKLIDQWYIGSLNVPRGAKALVLAKALAAEGISACYCFNTVENAYSEALANANKQDRIIVFGSFHTVAAVQTVHAQSFA